MSHKGQPMSVTSFHDLQVASVEPQGDGAIALHLRVPPELLSTFAFAPGQYLTLRAEIGGNDLRRCYSIASTPQHLTERGEVVVGVRAIAGGRFSTWANTELQAGQRLRVMPPQGRFSPQRPRALHRVGFASGSGITPILSILTDTLESSDKAKFTLVYGNRRMSSVMFNEALQDLKDRYASRLTLVHILSRQAQEVDLLEGRIDAAKVRAVVDALLPVASMDEVFVCGPEGMPGTVRDTLVALGVPERRIQTEHFIPAEDSSSFVASPPDLTLAAGPKDSEKSAVTLRIVLDGKTHEFRADGALSVLDAALDAGLDLPYSCKAGVCCTCRARLLEGEVDMARNFSLEAGEIERGFVLTCQARARTASVSISYDER